MAKKKRKYVRKVHVDGTPLTDAEKYDLHKESMRVLDAEKVAASQEIKPLPLVVDQARKDFCRLDLRLFAETYVRGLFKDVSKRWATFHLQAFETLQHAILNGGLFTIAVPRGSGKSAMIKAAFLWAAVYGHCHFGVVVCATDRLAKDFLKSLKTQLRGSKVLRDDFPEVCYPIRCLDNKASKANGQKLNGVRTAIEWGATHIVLATVPGFACSGFKITTSGITGSGLRGLIDGKEDGTEERPDVIAVDDFQTPRSAKSVIQTDDRLQIIKGSILGMAGPGEKFAVFVAVTVIQKGDGADQLLRDPNWQPIRFGVLNQMPGKRAMELWAEYREIQKESLAQKLGAGPECEFYRLHQVEMDCQCVATWPDRFNPAKELTAIQAAMNLYYLMGAKAFFAEHMNNPEGDQTGKKPLLKAEDVAKRLNNIERGVVPLGFDLITAMCDVQMELLWYVVMGWQRHTFTGVVLDYGWFPDQRNRSFNLNELTATLQSESGSDTADIEAAVWWGLNQFGEKVLDHKWEIQGGGALQVARCHPDIAYEKSASAVAKFCRSSKWAGILTPARGYGMKIGKTKISNWAPKPGQRHPAPAKRRDCEWMITGVKQHLLKECLFHPHHWKGRMNTAFSLPLHSPGSVSLYGSDELHHEMISQHATSHYPVEAGANDNKWTEWLLKPGVERDDLWDGIVGCAVAASIEGCELATEAVIVPKRKVFSMPGMGA